MDYWILPILFSGLSLVWVLWIWAIDEGRQDR